MEAFATAASFSIGFIGAGTSLQPTATTDGIIEAFIGAPDDKAAGGSTGAVVKVTGAADSLNVTARGDIDARARTDSISVGGLVNIGDYQPTAEAGGKTRAYAGNGTDLRATDLNLTANGDARADAKLFNAAVTGGVSVQGLKPTAITSNDVEAYVGRNDDAAETSLININLLNKDGTARGRVDALAEGITLADAKTQGFAAAGIVGVNLATAVAEMEGKTRAYVGKYTNLTAGDVNLTATELSAQARAEVASTSVSGAVDVSSLKAQAYAARITETFVGRNSTVDLSDDVHGVDYNLIGNATNAILSGGNPVPTASASISSVGGAGLVDVNLLEVVAVIGQQDVDSQQSATRSYVAREADISANNVELNALSNTTVEADASNFTAAGLVAASITNITAKGSHDSEVSIGEQSMLSLSGNLDMLADNKVTASPQSRNAGFAGAVSFGSATIKTELDSNTRAILDKNSNISAEIIEVKAKARHTANAAALNAGAAGLADVALLDVQVVDNGEAEIRIGAKAGDGSPGTTTITSTLGKIDLDAEVTSNVTALTAATSIAGLGSGVDTDTSATNNARALGHIGSGVLVTAATDFDLQSLLLGKTDATATSIQLSGAVNLTRSDTVSTFNPTVNITSGSGGSIHAGGDVSVLGLLNYDRAGEAFYRYTDGYGALGSADATSVAGLAAVDNTLITVNNNSDVYVTVGENMSLTAGQDVNVGARHSAVDG